MAPIAPPAHRFARISFLVVTLLVLAVLLMVAWRTGWLGSLIDTIVVLWRRATSWAR